MRSIPQKSNNWTGDNSVRYGNPQYDQLWNQSNQELIPEKRQAIFIKMNDMLVNDVMGISLIS